ncbi:MAG: rRNA maturation RNase YbeY [Anaerococcus vaginalis]|uniref:rRNA maturation RNase YbeY n=1 Tax=Anaerococcus vaginalis TaxID=33037 RepID=UPI00290D22E5|nr:rRNA maturation RNase YbeY [Anaerococcus vaginalis]MDU6182806.1 rRNA maturation RNase YbeY [Anaerococcus vaginalis]MDU6546380.1 rRNA maturation RNase YbeY [Anaerococcus vaginalis]
MKLIINNETNEDINIKNHLEKVIREVLNVEKVDQEKCEISLSFVDEEKIRQLNKDFRSIDRVTDVLSFPIEDFFNEDRENILEKPYLMLGDVVICLDVARKQADELGHSFEREIMYLTCHSIFHLLGYDHIEDDDKKIMRSKEKEVMKNLGVFK